MKILCLHGMGTNADILKAQTASFRSLLPSHFSFDFLEGEHDCVAADGIAEVYPEPYICWYPSPPNTDNVANAHEMIWDIVKEDGPFDGVMGFSQGAALAASVLLHHEINSPLEPFPFRFAIFICGFLPFSADKSVGFDLTGVFSRSNDPLPGDIEQWKRVANEAKTSSRPSQFSLIQQDSSVSSCTMDDGASDLYPGCESASDSDRASPATPATPYSPTEDVLNEKQSTMDSLTKKIGLLSTTDGSSSPICRFHPLHDKVRITIPTAHIYGKHDPYFSQSLQLVNMCQKDLVNVLDHGGAHDVPRNESASQAIANTIEKAITKSERML